MKKFYSDIQALCGLTVAGTTSLSTATGVTVATSDNSTKLATTAFVKAQGYATTAALAGYVPTTRTLTINGTTYDLSANRSWTISTADGYISNVQLVGSTLSFTGVGSAFSGIIDLSALNPTVRTVYETVKNVSGATILKGTPLAVVAGQTSGNISDVVPADAADPTKMPAIFIANQNIADQAEGEAVLFGNLTGVDTSLYQSGTTVYVAPGGGWTATKPVWPNLIQNLGVITKQHPTNGAGIVTGVGRANSLPNLTAGKIWVGSATYPIESTTVHVDEANARVGIGTTDINAGLHVNYSAANTVLIQRISDDSGPPEAIGRKARGTLNAKTGVIANDRLWFFAAAGYIGTEGVDGAWSANKVGMNFVASENWTSAAQGTHITWATTEIGQTTRTDKMILTGAGNLGIGTTSPAQKLHVVGNTTITGVTYTDVVQTYSGASIDFRHQDASVVMRVDTANARVGIGTSSPSNKLQVANGDMSITTGYSFILSDTDTNWRLGRNIISPVESVYLNSNTFEFVAANASDQGWQFINDDGYPVLEIGAATGSRNVWVNAGNLLVPTGNVGIGTTSPSQKLEVAGALVVGMTVPAPFWNAQFKDFSDGSGIYISSVNGGGGKYIAGNAYYYNSTLWRSDKTVASAINLDNGTVVFYTNSGLTPNVDYSPTERMRISSSGNLSIGNTNNTFLLDVGASSLYPFRALSSSGAGFQVNGSYIYADAYNHVFRSLSGTTTYATIDNNGNVGIGTTAPSSILHVDGIDPYVRINNVGSANTQGIKISYNYSDTHGFHLLYNGNNAASYVDNTYPITSGQPWGDIYFRQNSAGTMVTRMTIKADGGNVGIGTTSPSAQLHVGNGTSQQQWIVNQSIAGWYSGIKLARGAGNNSSIGNNNYGLVTTDNGLEFVNFSNISDASGTRYGVIAQGGNWGINTTGPGEKLHVVGRVRIDGGSTAAILETNDATASDAGTTYKTFTTADHYAVTVDYVIYDAGRTNMRTGTFRAVWSTGDVVYTDVSTVDLGATDNVTLTAVITGANVNLIVTGPTDYTLKYNLKVIK